ncbi:TPA_asm: hypothetical protein [Armillaria novae-zelandiae ambi-like virus 1]|uniref:Uncharacterized protein n=1 Tax=Armillaria novae-zelandiae ambi-like virus 1 TaxID=2803970 RepID=A0A8D9PD18_9VIRU|nr:TPA_asm: hypothetical protein [Armillaria novae-zelandiae ambi-like virus 1]
MSTETLVRTLNLTNPLRIRKELRNSLLPISLLIDSLYLFPISWRKLIVSTARIQQRSDNVHIDALYREIERSATKHVATDYGPFPITLLKHILDHIYHSPPFLSFLAYFARAETFSPLLDDPRLVIEQGLAKELSASQQGNRPQALNYSFLDPGNSDPVHKTGPRVPKLSEVWNNGLQRLQTRELSGYTVLYPHFNSKKNMGYKTQEALAQVLDLTAEEHKYSLTQRDVLLYYMDSGHQIQGPMEARWSWKLGHLKIRTYYCTGGTEFFAGLYMHDLCIWLYNIIPSTNINLRFDVTRVTVVPVNYDEVLITYDYSAFTTSLAELKYALFYLGQRLLGIKVPALDVKNGIFELDIGEYILYYNEVVNCHSAFDLCRIAPDAFIDILYQTRSGMLGAQGNIGLSTLLHGFSVSGYDDEPSGKSVVGDDALLKAKVAKLQEVIAYAKSLVDIASEKFSMWFRPDYEEDYSSEGFQYLKRPVSLAYAGEVQMGYLPNFPNVAKAIGFVDEFRHGEILGLPYERCIAFVKQYSSFLRELENTGQPCPLPLKKIILRCMRRVYRHFKLPSVGMIPGQVFEHKDMKDISLTYFIPSVRLKVLIDGWLETLFSDFAGFHTYVPKHVPKQNPIVAGYSAGLGDTFECTPIRVQNLSERLGFLRKRVITEEIIIGEANSFNEVKGVINNEFLIVVEFTCIKDLPQWYNHCITYTQYPYLHCSPEGDLVSSRSMQNILHLDLDEE